MKIYKITNKIGRLTLTLLLIAIGCSSAYSQLRRSPKSYVEGGMLIRPDTATTKSGGDSLRLDSLALDSLALDSLALDSLWLEQANPVKPDSLATPLALKSASPLHAIARGEEEKVRQPLFSDSMSLSKMCWISTVLPGYGQIYNKQYWKLPILYGTIGAGIALYVNENKTYKPLQEEYDNLILEGFTRTEELNTVQAAMIKSNTRRQLYMGAAIASYIYFLGDAAINYSTNDVSDIKKATTLSMICPGAGQIYNKSYWRVPIVIGAFASTIYVYDWNNRGYKRFQTAYSLALDYENNPDNYPNGSLDEFNGKYSASTLQNYRDSYRRNRDMAVIFTALVYFMQVLDAHVDAHLKDFDISDDLSLHVEPAVNYSNTPLYSSYSPSYGLNLNFRF
ncbi:MAG: DUF5683 domain-containing protein [Rikenellaceae bacterium]